MSSSQNDSLGLRRAASIVQLVCMATMGTACIALALDASAEDSPRPTMVPPVSWMLEPATLPDAAASTEAEMKPYTEKLPGIKQTKNFLQSGTVHADVAVLSVLGIEVGGRQVFEQFEHRFCTGMSVEEGLTELDPGR